MKMHVYFLSVIIKSLRSWGHRILIVLSKQKIKRLTKSSEKNIRVVIGSGGTQFDGWIPTDKVNLNILIENDWSRFWSRNSLDAILAEHVWEHLTDDEAIIAAINCFKYLKHGGYLRVAVPDGNHPSPSYIDQVKPGGSGAGADDHKVLHNVETLSQIFISAGFTVEPLEYFDEKNNFNFSAWDPSGGFVQRSKRFDSRNLQMPLTYTSLILDAKKI